MLPTILVYSAENTASSPYLPSSKRHLQIPTYSAENNGGKYRGKHRRKLTTENSAENNGGKYRGKYRRKLTAENTAENTGGKYCI